MDNVSIELSIGLNVSSVIYWGVVLPFFWAQKHTVYKYCLGSLVINCAAWLLSYGNHFMLIGILFVLNSYVYLLFVFLNREACSMYQRSKRKHPFLYKRRPLWKWRISLIDTLVIITVAFGTGVFIYGMVIIGSMLNRS